MKQKARLTDQTAPGRRFPSYWPTPGAEALVVAEADVPRSEDLFSYLATSAPNNQDANNPLGPRRGHTAHIARMAAPSLASSMSRLRSELRGDVRIKEGVHAHLFLLELLRDAVCAVRCEFKIWNDVEDIV